MDTSAHTERLKTAAHPVRRGPYPELTFTAVLVRYGIGGEDWDAALDDAGETGCLVIECQFAEVGNNFADEN